MPRPRPGTASATLNPNQRRASVWAEEEEAAGAATKGDPAVIEDLAEEAVEGKGAEALGEPGASTGTR